jgi:hypothetical protein
MSLQPGDLEDLVLPLLDIDSFNSKIDNQRAIVVAFQVTDQDPAYDLMKFIEGSNLALLDTEVSPAPSPEGYYIVFVEIARNPQFFEVLTELLEQVNNICDNKWQVKVYPQEKIMDFDSPELEDMIVTDPALIIPDEESAPIPQPTKQSVEMKEEFWQHADVNHVLVSEGHCVMYGQGHSMAWTIRHPGKKLGRLLLDESYDHRRLKTLLGPEYIVYNYERGLVVQRGGEQYVLQAA